LFIVHLSIFFTPSFIFPTLLSGTASWHQAAASPLCSLKQRFAFYGYYSFGTDKQEGKLELVLTHYYDGVTCIDKCTVVSAVTGLTDKVGQKTLSASTTTLIGD
jgi:hypothetical protein